MTSKNESPRQKLTSASLRTRMLLGAGLGLLLISIFLFGINNPDPEWGKYWMVRPMVIVPLAGAMGGLCSYLLTNYRAVIGLNKTLATVAGSIIFIIGLWLGFVLGLDGTLWD